MSDPEDRLVRLERMFDDPALRYRVLGALAFVAFLMAAWLESRFSVRSLADWLLFSLVTAGFGGIFLASFRPGISPRQLEMGWFFVLLCGIVWQAVHNYQQNLSFEVALQNFIYMTAAAATLWRREQLRYFLALSLANVSLVVAVLPDPEVAGLFFLSQMIAFGGFLYVILASGLVAKNRQKLTERRLRLSERSLRKAQQIARMGSFEFNPAGSLTFSESLWELLEVAPRPEVPIDEAFQLMDPIDKEMLLELVDDLTAGLSSEFELETSLFTGNGQRLDVRIIGQRSGSDAVLGTVQDVSHQAEQTRLLKEARRAAESAASVRTQFLANMSHEIRTPMNGVIGMTSLLADTTMSDLQRGYVETIRASGEALLHIINSILDFSKVDAGQIELESHAFDLEACLADALDVILPAATDKGLELLFDWDLTLPESYVGDSSRLRQVVINLLGNAVKFTESGEVCLRVVALPGTGASRGRQGLEISVVDSGMGIPADQLDQVFDAFTQADASTTRRFGGTGLGLSITRDLVALMGGEIRVESRPGDGSTFCFQLDLPVAGAPRPRDYRLLVGKRVLAVDDNETNRMVLEKYLQKLGMMCEVLHAPEALLERYQAHQDWDALILDMHMPGMDGATLAGRIRAHGDADGPPTPPLMLLSSLGDGEVGASFDCTFTKPVRPRQLADALINLLAGRSEAAEPSSTDAAAIAPAALPERFDCSVLVAEDNLVNQKVAQGLLRRLGVEADIVCNGQEAVDMLERRSYDVVLMDVQMPEVDGLEATRLIRDDDDIEQPRIIAMTANAMEQDRQECLQCGMDDFLPKPIRMPALVEVLTRAARDSVGTHP